jgi:hypothetical protein
MRRLEFIASATCAPNGVGSVQRFAESMRAIGERGDHAMTVRTSQLPQLEAKCPECGLRVMLSVAQTRL